MKLEKFKTKDFVLLGIITSIYSMIYIMVGALTAPLSILAHALMLPLVALFFGGTITVFLIYKIPKFGILSLFSLVFLLFFSVIGMSYLPMQVSTMLAAFLGDFISASSQYRNKHKNALAYGIINFGFSAGGVIPIWFFAQNYKSTWAKRGLSNSRLEENIQFYSGYVGVVILFLSFLGGVVGIYLGYKILKKHFKNEG